MMRAMGTLTTLALLYGCIGEAGRLQAEPITYVEQAVASGSLGSQSFSNALVTVTFTGDTANVTGGAGNLSNAVGEATVTVAGIGTATFTDSSVGAFVNQSRNAAGIADNNGSILDTFNSGFGSYNLSTPLGPLSGSPFIRPDLTFPTTLGGLRLGDAGPSTFTASTSIPEPSSLTIFSLLGVAGFGYLRWRRRKHCLPA